MATTVVHVYKDKFDIYIGRAWAEYPDTIWGNPFHLGPHLDGNRKEVLAKYRAYILSRPDLLARLPELKGKVLGCWCHPLTCHGDVLAELADSL